MIDQRKKSVDGDDIDIFAGPGGFRAAGGRANDAQIARIGGNGGGKDARDRRNASIERQFAQHHEALQHIAGDGAHGSHQPQSNGQIVMTALLGQIGRGEIDRNMLGR